jgi:TetR/AcrR family transcriptional regulator, transcriptional repressor for nem operon
MISPAFARTVLNYALQNAPLILDWTVQNVKRTQDMARPRSFRNDQVVDAAKAVFWNKGYRGTAIEDLERSTGLNRSSLYSAFGAKKAIFDLALAAYLDSFVAPRLAPLEGPGAERGDLERFFAGLAELLRTDERAQRGCLMINSIAELEGWTTQLDGRAEAFRDRLRTAFANALTSGHDSALAAQRAQLLTAVTVGIWLTARIDPLDAAQACDATIAQVRTW